MPGDWTVLLGVGVVVFVVLAIVIPYVISKAKDISK